jgi:hypothetical protein
MTCKINFQSRVLTLAVLSSLIASSIPSLVASAADFSGTRTPEMTLLIRETAISGENLSRDQQQKDFTQALQKYNADAPQEGRQERMKEALIRLNMMSSARAQDFQNQISKAVQAELTANPAQSAPDVVEHAASTVVSHLRGAQFSDCGNAVAIGAVLSATLAGCIVEYNHLSKNDIYSENDTASGSVVVSKSNPNEVYPILGAVAAGVGLALDFAGVFGMCD